MAPAVNKAGHLPDNAVIWSAVYDRAGRHRTTGLRMRHGGRGPGGSSMIVHGDDAKRVHLRLPEKLLKGLDRIAERHGRSRNSEIVTVLWQYVREQQQQEGGR
jgi:hypothetical protein